jgi:hypothetical protein
MTISGEPEVRMVRLDQMSPATYNPRKMTKASRMGLRASLEEFGILSLIVWNERSGNIVGGHQRYKELVDSGEIETQVVVVDLSENDEVALNLSLNNERMRGDFTRQVMVALAKTEVQMGSKFNKLRLNDLHSRLSRINWDPGKKSPRGPKEPSRDPKSSEIPDPNSPDAVVACPECDSLWKLSDNKVIYDATEKEYEDSELGDTDGQFE